MAHINGVFSPNEMSEWPVLDLANADIKRDIETLPSYSEMRASRSSKRESHVSDGDVDMKAIKMDKGHADTTSASSMSSMPGMSRRQQRGDSTHH